MRNILLLLLTLFSLDSIAQKISGLVKDEKGNELPFSTILLKGTTKGTSANDRGRYSFETGSGTHRIICRRVGFKSEERQVTVGSEDVVADFVLADQQLELSTVVVKTGGEDPAYAIIRNAIKARKANGAGFDKLSFDMYTKDQIRLRSVPTSVFGKKIKEEDKKDMGVDSLGKGIIYLSENVSTVDMQKPDGIKINVQSSRVSGSNSFGFTMPISVNLYDNNVIVFTSQINPRGFISPIADGALNYYRFKLLGSYYENGNEINTIQVTPRRQNEPLFSGVINIMEDSWRIFSTSLTLTKKQQLELLDTLTLNQQYVAVDAEKWKVKTQEMGFAAKLFGFEVIGNFLGVYSDYNSNPAFDKNYFDKVFLVYDTASTKRLPNYWDSIRPVPLELDEAKDYRVKDSAFRANQALRNTKAYKDSINRLYNKYKPKEGIIRSYTWRDYSKDKGFEITVKGLLTNLEYNTAEGLVANLDANFSIPVKKATITLNPVFRYGFSNERFNPWLRARISPERKPTKTGYSVFEIAGGRRVTEFNKESQLSTFINAVSTLFWGRNHMKIYENNFASAGYEKVFESGLKLKTFLLYEDRKPLENTTDYVFNKSKKDRLTPNYPIEKITSQFSPHQAVNLTVGLSYQPGQRYIQFPDRKVRTGSGKPVYSFWYTKGLKNVMGSDVDFDKWSASITDHVNLRMAGSTAYKLGIGGFLNNKAVPIQDYQHFSGNRTLLASDYLNSFQLASYYANSTTEKFYGIGHLEHHFNGLFTNKIPLFNRLKWHLVAGSNAFYVNNNNNYVAVSYTHLTLPTICSV